MNDVLCITPLFRGANPPRLERYAPSALPGTYQNAEIGSEGRWADGRTARGFSPSNQNGKQLCVILCVDLDIVIAIVTGPDGGLLLADVQVHHDPNLRLAQVFVRGVGV